MLAKFVELGIPVYIPFGDTETEDLVIKVNNQLKKIQVKTSVSASDGCMLFSLVSSTLHRSNGSVHVYTSDEVDYFACYNIERDVVLLLPFSEFGNMKSASIRYEKARNAQKRNIHYEEDYLIEKILNIYDRSAQPLNDAQPGGLSL